MASSRWVVTVEYDAHVPEDAHDVLADYLVGTSASISDIPCGLSITLSVTAPTFERAQAAALRATDRAVLAAHGRASVSGITVLTEEEFDRRNTEPIPLPELAGRAEVAQIMTAATGRTVSPTRAGQMMRTKKFQTYAPIVQELAATPVCLAHQVRHYAEIWATLPGPGPKPDHSKDI